MMKLAAVLLFSGLLQAQTCTHQLTHYPASIGSVLVYRNGLLLDPTVDYTISASAGTALLTLTWWNSTDKFQFVYDRKSQTVPSTVSGQTVETYILTRETSTCSGSNPAPGSSGSTVVAPDQETISQTIPGVAALERQQCNLTGSSPGFPTCTVNTASQSCTYNPAPASWPNSCFGIELLTFTFTDGTKELFQSILTPAAPSGSNTWPTAPIEGPALPPQ